MLQAAGVWQAVIGKLDAGDWVHYFPEGVIRQDGHIRMFRRGVGRLVASVRSETFRDPTFWICLDPRMSSGPRCHHPADARWPLP